MHLSLWPASSQVPVDAAWMIGANGTPPALHVARLHRRFHWRIRNASCLLPRAGLKQVAVFERGG
jgi:hypothetical protein